MASIKLKGDTSGEITIQAPSVAGTNTLNLQASSGTLATTAQASVGTKNRIINGDMRIDQRNGTSTINATGVTYNVDRWLGRGVGSAGVFTLAQDTTSPANFTNSLKATVTTADSSIASGSSYRVQQFIEGYNIADLAWGTANAQTVTLSFWVRSSLTGTFGGSVANGNFDRFNVFSYTISSADTWEYKTVTIAGDTSGTWATNQNLAIRLNFSLGAGSSILTSAGSWGSVAKEGVTGQTNVIATTGATWYITGVQLEVGTEATPFENRMYSTELALCQRYYQSIEAGVNAYSSTGITGFPLNTAMRATPTLTFSYSGTANRVYRIDTGGTSDLTVAATALTDKSFISLFATSPAGWASAAGIGFRSIFVFSAEL